MKAASLVIIACLAFSCQPKEDGASEIPIVPDPADRSPANNRPMTPSPGDPDPYLGLTREAAGERADAAGILHRVVEIDGESRPVTMDHRPDRVNFAIRDGLVIRVTKG